MRRGQVAFHRGPGQRCHGREPMPHTSLHGVNSSPGRIVCVVSPRTRDERNTIGGVRQHAHPAVGQTFAGHNPRATK
jgi:hypothetical protein